jgi:hypothetical protein
VDVVVLFDSVDVEDQICSFFCSSEPERPENFLFCFLILRHPLLYSLRRDPDGYISWLVATKSNLFVISLITYAVQILVGPYG